MRYIRVAAIVFCLGLLFPVCVLGDEGMWPPDLIGHRVGAMRAMGCRLDAEDLYREDGVSLKDAIVRFGRGCSGSFVSSDGLVLTNHHCAQGAIQKLSSVEKDYLRYGYGRGTRIELPCEGLSVSVMVRMGDVTKEVLSGLGDFSLSQEADRSKAVAKRVDSLISVYRTQDSALIYEIKPLYSGNQYYLYVSERYHDVRLVYAPPSCLGAFGGDSDNWDWPRHASDFALLRVYADAENRPAGYSSSNRPYRPRRYLKLSVRGVSAGDFVMVYGYPGSTRRYTVSQGVEQVMDSIDPRRVRIRDARLRVMRSFMSSNDTVRIQYASKYQGVANAWKKWQGESMGLRRLDAPGVRRSQEEAFSDWVMGRRSRRAKYGSVLPRFDSIYRLVAPLEQHQDYFIQGVRGIESLSFAMRLSEPVGRLRSVGSEGPERDTLLSTLRAMGEAYFKDYHGPLDERMGLEMLGLYFSGMDKSDYLPSLALLSGAAGGWSGWFLEAHRGSLLTDAGRFASWVGGGADPSVLEGDDLYKLGVALFGEYRAQVGLPLGAHHQALEANYRTYIGGLMEMHRDTPFFPDANMTPRIAYGRVEGYQAREAVEYTPHTSVDGLLEKVTFGREDYVVPARFDSLVRARSFGPWAVDGSVPACFLASIHTTGGNSGSAVLNGRGELVGLNFDRVWEGTMSDLMFDPERCRNISVDIRFVLWMIGVYGERDDLISSFEVIR